MYCLGVGLAFFLCKVSNDITLLLPARHILSASANTSNIRFGTFPWHTFYLLTYLLTCLFYELIELKNSVLKKSILSFKKLVLKSLQREAFKQDLSDGPRGSWQRELLLWKLNKQRAKFFLNLNWNRECLFRSFLLWSQPRPRVIGQRAKSKTLLYFDPRPGKLGQKSSNL